MLRRLATVVIVSVAVAVPAGAVEDAIELETTRIITNEELPGLLYLVPWKDVEASQLDNQKLVLHDFFGDLYDPILPTDNTRAIGGD